MDIKDIKLSEEQVCGSTKAILTAKAPYYLYANGQRGASPEGIRYTVSCPRHQLQSVSVKIPGTDTTPEIVPDELDARTAKLDFQFVTFDGFVGKMYAMDGKSGITCTATSIHLVDESANSDAVNIEFGTDE